MKTHTANELLYTASIIGPDAVTVLSAGVAAGVTDLDGRTLEQAQLIASKTTHMILMHYLDAQLLNASSYVLVDGLLYIVDYTKDPRSPRPKMWVEIYCHAERTAS